METKQPDNTKRAEEDRTDPFLPAMAEEAEVVAVEGRLSQLLRMGAEPTSPVKWLFTGRRIPASVRKLLPEVPELLPWAEDLVLDETAYTARGFDNTVAELAGDLSAHNLLTLLQDAYSFETALFGRAGMGLNRFDPSRIFLADENATGLSGHTRFALRVYHLEDFASLKREPKLELVRGLAKLGAEQMQRQGKENPRFADNCAALQSAFDEVAKEPALLPGVISRLRLRLEVASVSHTGLVRPGNEDALLVLTSRMEDGGRGSAVFAVADGMGGHQAGEVASAMSLELLRLYSGMWALAQPIPTAEGRGLDTMMRQHLALIGSEILEMGSREPRLAGMGTTLTGCVLSFRGDIESGAPWGSLSARVFNVGDSRTFAVNAAGCHPLTRDHSLVQELLDDGSIDEEEAFEHPQRNIITRALGTGHDVQADTFDLQLPLDACVVMASDGLTDLVRPQRLSELAVDAQSAQELAQKYLAEALAAGGTDNITVIVLKPHLTLLPGE